MLLLLLYLLAPPPDNPSLGHQNQYPLYIPWLTVMPKAVPSSSTVAVRVAQRYTAMHYFAKGGGWEYGQDMEQSQWLADVAFNTRFGQILVSQGVVFRHGGVLDPFLNAYHEALSLPNYGRETRPENAYEFTMSDGKGWSMSPRGGIWLPMDPVVTWFRPGQVDLALSVKVPVYGYEPAVRSGSADIGVEVRKTTGGEVWSGTASMGWIHRMASDSLPGTFTGSTPHAGVAVGRRVSAWTWSAELATHPPLFSGTDFPRLEKATIELVLGATFPTRLGRFTVSFSEDLSITAPDFTIGVAWSPLR